MAAKRDAVVVQEPKADSGAKANSMCSTDSGIPGRKRILLVEGDGFTRLVLLLRLRLAGFIVDFTSNGILGLGKLRQCKPDILLVELKLCGLSGLQLIKAAREEEGFGDRPVYVFTHAERMSRSTRREIGHLATEVFDKAVMSREDLVQVFTAKFLKTAPKGEPPVAPSEAEQPATAPLNETVLPAAIEELIAGVREQLQPLVGRPDHRAENGRELLSRVCSVASCASAAGLADLGRQAKALQDFVSQLDKNPHSYTEPALGTVTRAVEVMSGIPITTQSRKGPSTFSVVYVDECSSSNKAVEEALLKAAFAPVCFEEPVRAKEYLACHKSQLIIVNLALPEAHELSAAEIHKMPLHAATPVLFGPERTIVPATREDMPGSAPRLDKSMVLLSELVLKALNEVQSAKALAGQVTLRAPSETASQSVPPQPSSTPSLPAEDGFELFARSPAQAEAPLTASPVSGSVPSSEANQQPLRLNRLFAAAGIPNQPIVRAEPELAAQDNEATEEIALPTHTADGFAAEEHPLEAFPFAALRATTPQSPEPEQIAEDQAASLQMAAEANIEPEQNLAPTENYAETDPNQATELSQPAEQAANDGEIMNTELLGLSEHKAQARCAELEQEVAALRQALEGLNGGFAEPQQSSPELTAQVQELEFRLAQQAEELAKQKEEQQRAESELRQQLEARNSNDEQAEAARQQAEARCAQLEQELNKERQEREALASKTAHEQKNGAQRAKANGNGSVSDEGWAGLPANELEQQVRQGVAALAKATAELAKERGERQRAQQLAADLNGRLQALHQDFSRTLQVQGEHLGRISALEQERDQAQQAHEKCAADLEQHLSERVTAIEELQKAKDLTAQLRKDATFFEEANKRSDAARQELQTRLEASLAGARENEAKLLQETTERKRLSENLDASRRELQEHARKHELLQHELKTAHDALQDR
ncbi:MAG TPA: hypothetical protein VL793_11660, partial [Patescibacteria group bacterium]|nr:hypothetical protein [Patescibacteria group bacterium]